MAVTIWGLTIGNTPAGWVVPTLAELREAAATKLRQWRGIANLVTSPGSLYGDLIDITIGAVDVSLQGSQEAVDRTIFNRAQDTALDQLVMGYVDRVPATPSTVVAYAYGTAGSPLAAGLSLRTSLNGTAFSTNDPVVVPAVPAEAYAVEVQPFEAGDFAGDAFILTVDGTLVPYVANGSDTGETVRNGLVDAVNLLGLTQTAYRGGVSPTNGTYCLLLVEESGAGPFPLVVGGPLGQMVGFPAIAVRATAVVDGPTQAPPESLRYFPPTAGIVGVTNPDDAGDGRVAETDSQLRARFQIVQRGMGGGNPDAVRAILLSDPAVGGGGATFATVEYNPTSVVDSSGNVPHSLRAIVDSDADPATVAIALWKAKAAGDNMNGAIATVIQDAAGGDQTILHDVLEDVYISAIIAVSVGPDWPVTGDPLSQLRTDVVAYIESLQPSPTGGVRVNLLPISTYPDGTSRGVINFTVQVGDGAAPGGPFTYRDTYPTVDPDADAASVLLDGRKKARAVITDVTASII